MQTTLRILTAFLRHGRGSQWDMKETNQTDKQNGLHAINAKRLKGIDFTRWKSLSFFSIPPKYVHREGLSLNRAGQNRAFGCCGGKAMNYQFQKS